MEPEPVMIPFYGIKGILNSILGHKLVDFQLPYSHFTAYVYSFMVDPISDIAVDLEDYIRLL